VNLNGGYQFNEQFFASMNVQFFSKRRDIFYDPITYDPEQKILAAYSLVSIYAEYEFEKKVKLFVDVKNIFDKKDYYEIYGFTVQGINITGGIRFKF
jgi:vitamin B12 transporter